MFQVPFRKGSRGLQTTYCISAAAIFIKDSATAILAEAAGEIKAMLGFSPMLIASPVNIPAVSDLQIDLRLAFPFQHGPQNPIKPKVGRSFFIKTGGIPV